MIIKMSELTGRLDIIIAYAQKCMKTHWSGMFFLKIRNNHLIKKKKSPPSYNISVGLSSRISNMSSECVHVEGRIYIFELINA